MVTLIQNNIQKAYYLIDNEIVVGPFASTSFKYFYEEGKTQRFYESKYIGVLCFDGDCFGFWLNRTFEKTIDDPYPFWLSTKNWNNPEAIGKIMHSVQIHLPTFTKQLEEQLPTMKTLLTLLDIPWKDIVDEAE